MDLLWNPLITDFNSKVFWNFYIIILKECFKSHPLPPPPSRHVHHNKRFISPALRTIFMLLLNKKLFLAVIIETVPSLFYLHTLCTQFTAILILIDGQYSQSVVFRFEKGCDCQNHSSSDSHSQLKKSSPSNFLIAPHTGRIPYYPLTPFGKPCVIP